MRVATFPTLLLYGEVNQRSPLHLANELRDRIPPARLEAIPAAGHVGNAEAPSEFTRRVREFFHSVGAAP